MTRHALRSLFAFVLLAGVGACEGSEIVVFAPSQAGSAGNDAGGGGAGTATGGASGGSAGLSDSGGGGGATSGSGGSSGKTCQTTDDCDSSLYCEKQNCTDSTGVCLPAPLSEDPQLKPVCGCDNITYWNDTLRKSYGISSSTPKECPNPQTCFSSDECGPDGTCSHRVRDLSRCGMPGIGQCWIIPSECSATDDSQEFLPCPPPGPPGQTPACPPILTTCQALRSDQPFLRKPGDYHCP